MGKWTSANAYNVRRSLRKKGDLTFLIDRCFLSTVQVDFYRQMNLLKLKEKVSVMGWKMNYKVHTETYKTHRMSSRRRMMT